MCPHDNKKVASLTQFDSRAAKFCMITYILVGKVCRRSTTPNSSGGVPWAMKVLREPMHAHTF